MNSHEVKQLRKDFNFSQLALSKATGISRYRLSMFENGYCDLKFQEIQKIQDAIQRLAVTRYAKFTGDLR